MSPLGLITGMKSEAALLYAAAQDGSGPVCPMIAVTGGDPLRAETAAREFATAGAAGLIAPQCHVRAPRAVLRAEAAEAPAEATPAPTFKVIDIPSDKYAAA